MNSFVALLLLMVMGVGYHFGGYLYAIYAAIAVAGLFLILNLIRGKHS